MGHSVAASVKWWPDTAPQLSELLERGVDVVPRREPGRLGRLVGAGLRAFGRQVACPMGKLVEATAPDFVVISNGSTLPPTGVVAVLSERSVPYLNLAQANREDYFILDTERAAVREYVRRATCMAFVSRANLELFERQIAMPVPNAVVVRNPYKVPRTADYSSVLPASVHDVRAACVGRLHPQSKGQDLLVDVLSRDYWRSTNATVDLYGSGPHEELLRDLVRLQHLDGTIRFQGHFSDIGTIWQDHQVLVLPSRYEGLPLAVVEAMLCGRVVITTDVGGAKELIEDGVSGFIAKGANADALDDAMRRAWSRFDAWPDIGAAARARALSEVPQDPGQSFADLIVDFLGGAGKLNARYGNG
jgi:glycosyltransferase involved in cell wall biosynthesis